MNVENKLSYQQAKRQKKKTYLPWAGGTSRGGGGCGSTPGGSSIPPVVA